jgi:hypothetical protein
MPVVTYLPDYVVKRCRRVINDSECDDTLQVLRAVTGEDWIIEVVERRVKCRAWHGLSHIYERVKFYILYADCHGEWQIINLCTPKGGSVFHNSRQSREDVINFMLGYIGGRQRVNQEKPDDQPSH